MNRYVSLVVMFAILCGCSASDQVAQPDVRPNILWLIGENLGPDLGCYGTEQVSTPNLDELAKQGVLYTHAFATSPVCSPSRSAFMTGMYQTSIGAHNHRSHRRDGYRLPEGARLLTHRLQDAGYLTADIRRIGDRTVGTGKTDLNFTVDGPIFETDRWEDLKTNQPFYAQVNCRYVERDSDDPNLWKDYDTLPKVADPARVKIPPYYPDHPTVRRDWATYLNSVSAMDRDIGYVLEKLEADGLADNTIVIFFGDNGRLMARGLDWCYDSGERVPMMIRWPEGIASPEQYRAGTVTDQLISLIDVTATTLSLAGVQKPENMQGRVFLGQHAEPERDYVAGARDRTDDAVNRIRSIRTKRYRYVRNFRPDRPFLFLHRYKEQTYPVLNILRDLHARGQLTPAQETLMAYQLPKEELYDSERDPHEIHNLAQSTNPEHQRLLMEMSGILDRWMDETGDMGSIPEDPEVLLYWEQHQFKTHGGPPLRTIEELR